MLTLENTKTEKKHFHQLFGNNQYFKRLHDYINKLSGKTETDWEYIEDVEIPDYKELIKIIDETVFHEIIKKHELKQNSDHSFYSEITDFSQNVFFAANKTDNDLFLNDTLFEAARSIVQNMQLFQSYAYYLWLRKYNALSPDSLQQIQHDYTHPEKKIHYTILGDLKPKFKLYISYY